MKKNHVIKLFGSVRKTAIALGITTQAVYAWPDPLSAALDDKIRGAISRLGLSMPKKDLK